MPFAAFATDAPAALVLWYVSIGGWLGLLIWRRYRAQAFRVAYVGDGEIVYTVRAESYASEFARENNLSYERRAIVMRLA
jgi:disulfide oxidoreductase YuzD